MGVVGGTKCLGPEINERHLKTQDANSDVRKKILTNTYGFQSAAHHEVGTYRTVYSCKIQSKLFISQVTRSMATLSGIWWETIIYLLNFIKLFPENRWSSTTTCLKVWSDSRWFCWFISIEHAAMWFARNFLSMNMVWKEYTCILSRLGQLKRPGRLLLLIIVYEHCPCSTSLRLCYCAPLIIYSFVELIVVQCGINALSVISIWPLCWLNIVYIYQKF